MTEAHKQTAGEGSTVDPVYSKGDYFQDTQRHCEDAKFKADNFVKVFLRFAKSHTFAVNSFVDVGCGSGDIVKMIADSLSMHGFQSVSFKAYDVSPHVKNIRKAGVDYIYGDFCSSDEFVDVVTLFDVFEHVPDTIEFLKSISRRCKIIGFHIPLDCSINFAMRNMFHASLHNPGHLVFMDISSALNLLAMSGLRVVDYEYAFGAPIRHGTMLEKVVFPFRYILARINPWLLSRTLGGTSLIVIAITQHGLNSIQRVSD